MKLSEIGYITPNMPTTGGSMPAPGSQPRPPAGAQTPMAVQPPGTAANVRVGGATVMDPNKFKKDIINKIKTDSRAAEKFGDLLATLLTKK